MTRCRTTGKVIYKSKTKAERSLHTAIGGATADQHAYRCDDSPSHWHLGHNGQLPPNTPTPSGQPLRWNRADWDQATLALWGRCRDLCESCGKPLGGQLERHHRQRRAVGGDRLANLVALHPACHAWAHAHPEEARTAGVVVSAYEPDPGLVPLVLPDGRAVLLTDEGWYSPI